MRVAFVAVLAWLALAFAATAGPYEDGEIAYSRGDYAAAVALWQPLAEAGHVEAQLRLAHIYDTGLGGLRDAEAAARWYGSAAAAGNIDAQTGLGFLYMLGDGLEEDIVRAYAWFSLAAAGDDGDAIAADMRDFLGDLLTEEELAESKAMVSELTAPTTP